MTTLEAVAGAAMVVAALAGATKYRPGKDSRLKLALIVVLVLSGTWLSIGQWALEASREVQRIQAHAHEEK